MKSLLVYQGKVRHRRFFPKKHEFSYQVKMLYFDISDIEGAFKSVKNISVEKFNWLSFYRKNYFTASEKPLNEAVRELIQEKYTIYPRGKIFLLTQLSCLGYCFNPISVYYIFKENSEELDFVMLEVTNTPWHERHHYILHHPKIVKPNVYSFEFEKKLHVSPFMKMNYNYKLNLKRDTQHLIVHLSNYVRKDMSERTAEQESAENKLDFDATLSLSPISQEKLDSPLRFALMTYKITAAIYWESFKIWLKGVAYQSHPKQQDNISYD